MAMLRILRKLDFLRSLFGMDKSASHAKERLRIVLIQDQSNISSELLNVLRNEMVGVVSRYLEIDLPHLEMGIERKDGTIALAANIPIVRIRKEARALVPGAVPEPPASTNMAKEAPSSSSKVQASEALEKKNKTNNGGAGESSKAAANALSKPDRRQRRGRKHLRTGL